jgi:GNAT superfamily N-acetyltransferase
MVETTGLILRAARHADAAALARVRVASLLEQGMLDPAAAPRFEREAFAELRERFAREEISAWIAVDEGRLVASACLVYWRRLPYPGTSLHAELAGVYVEPAYRRRGLARELCREAIAAGRVRDVRRISVHPSPAGRELYAQLGFTPSGELRL